MKRLAVMVSTVILTLLFLTPAYAGHKISIESMQHPGQAEIVHSVLDNFKDMDRPYEGQLPWEYNIKFLQAMAKNRTPILMAAYRATLHDPILAEGYNIGLAADQLAGTVVSPGKIFSQNDTIGPYTEDRGYRAGPTYAGNRLVTTVGGGVCKIATLLYNVTTFCDLQIIMRCPHSMTVPYVPPGQDATVYYGVRDFRFLNSSGGPILIWSQKVDDTLYMAMYGTKRPPKVRWHHKIIKKINYWTVYQQSPLLPPGVEKVISPGQDGYIVKSWVTVEMPGGIVTTKKKGTSHYSACPRIIERGPQ